MIETAETLVQKYDVIGFDPLFNIQSNLEKEMEDIAYLKGLDLDMIYRNTQQLYLEEGLYSLVEH